MGRGRIIEGTWNCVHCENKKILARYKNCPNCGAPQGKETNFDMPDKITYVSKEEANKISRNPDWLCSFCEQLNKDTDGNCKGCGATKEDSEKNYFQMKKEREEKEAEEKRLQEEFERKAYISSNNEMEATSNSKTFSLHNFLNNVDFKIFGTISASILGLILFIWGIVALVTPNKDVLNVTELSWERVVSIEKEKTVNESDWSVPSGGRIQYTKQEIHHYDQVLDHYETVTEQKSRQVISGYETVTEQKSRQVISGYEDVVTGYRDLGNGYFEEITSSQPVYTTEYYTESHEEPVYTTEYYTETHQEPVYRDEPVYKTKYYYEIDRWFHERNITFSGINDEPYWGEIKLEEKERESGRKEVYKLKAINSKEEEKPYTIDYNNWSKIKVGDTLNVLVYFSGKIEIIDENGNPIELK